MIYNGNIIMKKLWVWQAKRKLTSDDPDVVFTALRILEFLGKTKHIQLMLDLLKHEMQYVRNQASLCIQSIFNRIIEIEEKKLIETTILDQFNNSTSIFEKLVLTEIIRLFNIRLREAKFGPILKESEDDLQYAIIRSLADTTNIDILDSVLESADTHDLVLRKSALSTWYHGIKNLDIDDSVEYAAPRLHFLIRAVYELQTDGQFLKEILALSNKNNLPKAKAYPDYIIRYFTELLGKWQYDPDAYRSLHQVVVPSYFTFESKEQSEEERPFIIL